MNQITRVKPDVKGFFDPRTWSIQYVVSDPATRVCAIIDPVLDFDEKSGATGTVNADAILAYVAANDLMVAWILDTHPHADHFSAAHYLHEKTGAPTAIGEHVVDVQRLWKGIYNLPSLPPGGSAKTLWASIQDILALPDETRVFTGHDYQPGGREPRWQSTVGDQKRLNPHLVGKSEAEFIALREARDRTLPMPKLILHALQVNVRGGRLPEPEDNGGRYLKFPLDALAGAAWE